MAVPGLAPSDPRTATAPNPNRFLLKPHQRIFFIGDSITFRGNYTRQTQAYLDAIYPSYHLQFQNTGVGAWTATNFLQYDYQTDDLHAPTGLKYALDQKPDIAVICFGTNDAGYLNESKAFFTLYQSSMTAIVQALKKAGTQVVLLTPGRVDTTVPWAADTTHIPKDYNETLGRYTQWVLELALREGIPAFDLHGLALKVDKAARAAHPGLPAYTDYPQDGVHPNPSGGLVYVYGLLTALGVPYQSRSMELDLASGKAVLSAGLSVSGFEKDDEGCSFHLTAYPRPYIHNPQAAKVLPFLDFQEKFNNIRFTVKGLTASHYYLVLDGIPVGPVAASALSSGINLLDYFTQPNQCSPDHGIQIMDAARYSAPHRVRTLIDDFEESNDFPATPRVNGAALIWPQNLWGGYWYGGSANGKASTSNPSPFVMTEPGHGSKFAANLSGISDPNGGQQLLLNYCYTQYTTAQDGLQFWFKGTAGKDFRFQCRTEPEDLANPPLYSDYGHDFIATGDWQRMELPFSRMAPPSGADPSAYAFDPGQITMLEWLPISEGPFQMSVADLAFYRFLPGLPKEK